ncbi:MAG: FadR/GntR family transcriptional regulator [Eubacteriales bacterium]
MFKKIEYRRLYEDVISQIEANISSEQLMPGDRLPSERELAEKVGVSRGTLREAFRILERQGMITARPGGGRYVKKLPDGRMDRDRILLNLETAAMLDLLEAREVIESRIVELACARATRADLEVIERSMAVIENSDAESGKVLDRDNDFHLAIAEATHNIVFVGIVELNLDLLFQIRLKTSSMPGRANQIAEEHRAIFKAIKQRDVNKAKETMLDHLKNISSHLEKC